MLRRLICAVIASALLLRRCADTNTAAPDTEQHWHGIFQHSHAYVDGLAFVNQCPIAPNETFLYDFTAVGQAGAAPSKVRITYNSNLRG